METLIMEMFGKMENGLMIRTVIVVGALLLGVGAVMAQQDVVNQTQTVMKANGKNAGALAAMVKGEKPYDQATVDAALKQFEDTAKKLPTLFPESTKGLKPDSDYSASSVPRGAECRCGGRQRIGCGHKRSQQRCYPCRGRQLIGRGDSDAWSRGEAEQ